MLVKLPYLEKDEKCTCNSCSYNDAQSPDFWVYKNYHIYITEEGMFDIYKMDEKKNILSKKLIKTCSSLHDAIFYIKYSEKLSRTFKEITVFDLSNYKNFYITLLSETEWDKVNEEKYISRQLIQKREILLSEKNIYNIHDLCYENAHLILKVPNSMLK